MNIKSFGHYLLEQKKIKPKYDTIIKVATQKVIVNDFLYRLNKIIKCNNEIESLFSKHSVQEIYECGIDNVTEDEYNILDISLQKMIKNNDSIFSYKYIPEKLRNKIKSSCYLSSENVNSKIINDKDILILDDTITSGKTISDSTDAILKTYSPKSITIITLFSGLN